jgi:hypothetical protein
LLNFFGLNWRNLKHVGFRWRSFTMTKLAGILVALPFLLGVAMGQVVINDRRDFEINGEEDVSMDGG